MNQFSNWIPDQCNCHERLWASTGVPPTSAAACSRAHSLLVCTVVASCVMTAAVSGCGRSAMPPPVTVTFRDSVWGVGKVVQIHNHSAHHLYNVKVIGRNFNEIESGSVRVTEELAPHDDVEVGWLEFDGWVPKPGETIEVYADDYLVPSISVVPK